MRRLSRFVALGDKVLGIAIAGVRFALVTSALLGAPRATNSIRKRPGGDPGKQKADLRKETMRVGYRLEQRVSQKLEQDKRGKVTDRKYLPGEVRRERRRYKVGEEGLRAQAERERERARARRRRASAKRVSARRGRAFRRKRKRIYRGGLVQ